MAADNIRTENERYRFCRLCDIIDSIPEDIGEYAEKLYGLLDENERAGEELIRSRMDICEECDRNMHGTCLACGCYCLIRCFAVAQRCPKKKW
ncbi:MAG: hypothetical protein IKP31_04270 [Lachnospiraceae bacterium]|nr:hypothetical protein [Lachnospiraceae bacterium]